jgi:hypothetical protein
MACAECARQAVPPGPAPAPQAPEEAAGAELLRAHVPLDEHEDPAGERVGGYTPCAACGAEGSEPALDASLVACHRLVGASSRVAAGGTLQHTREEYRLLRELLDGEGRALSTTHWLACEVRWRLQAASAALLAQGATGGAGRLELLRAHAEHSLALVAGLEPIVPERSHLMAAVCERAADALSLAQAAATTPAAPSTAPATARQVAAAGSGRRAPGPGPVSDVVTVAWADAENIRRRARELHEAARPVLELVSG